MRIFVERIPADRLALTHIQAEETKSDDPPSDRQGPLWSSPTAPAAGWTATKTKQITHQNYLKISQKYVIIGLI